jgi:hypothetical protein
MKTNATVSLEQALQDRIESYKNRIHIGRLEALQSAMNIDQRLLAQVIDNLPPMNREICKREG